MGPSRDFAERTRDVEETRHPPRRRRIDDHADHRRGALGDDKPDSSTSQAGAMAVANSVTPNSGPPRWPRRPHVDDGSPQHHFGVQEQAWTSCRRRRGDLRRGARNSPIPASPRWTAALHLSQQHPPAGNARPRSGDRRLAGAALAGDDVHGRGTRSAGPRRLPRRRTANRSAEIRPPHRSRARPGFAIAHPINDRRAGGYCVSMSTTGVRHRSASHARRKQILDTWGEDG